MAAPTGAEFWDNPLIAGVGLTVNPIPLLEIPPAAVTTTLPVVAPAGTVAAMLALFHRLTAAGVPLKVTLPLP